MLLKVDNLQVSFKRDGKSVTGVRDMSFSINEGENLALIGESGSGKSVTALSCMRLLDNNAVISQGTVMFEGEDLTKASEKFMEKIRGSRISMIFQEHGTSLNPVLSVKYQLAEAFRLHTTLTKKQIHDECVKLMEEVGIADPEKTLNFFPHELSGGMRQRVIIAMALACKPRLLIADEPTTALDLTIQAQMFSLLRKLQKEIGFTIMIITHDFGVVAETADKVLVMYAGIAVETGSVVEIFTNPLHPYTKGLLKSVISVNADTESPLYTIKGMPPRALSEENSCPFYERCSERSDICKKELPAMTEQAKEHFVRCFSVFCG